jgi:hypothetical protein
MLKKKIWANFQRIIEAPDPVSGSATLISFIFLVPVSVVDQEPVWIPIQLVKWIQMQIQIRIRIRIQEEQEAKRATKKVIFFKFHILKSWIGLEASTVLHCSWEVLNKI